MPAKGYEVRPLADPVRSATKLRDLLRRIEAEGVENAKREDLGSILAVSLGLRKQSILSSSSKLEIVGQAIILRRGREIIGIPAHLIPRAKRLAELKTT